MRPDLTHQPNSAITPRAVEMAPEICISRLPHSFPREEDEGTDRTIGDGMDRDETGAAPMHEAVA